jgi:endonuclease YncB( thermonuclease family)
VGVAIALLFLGCGIAGGEPLPAPLVVEETARAERAIDPDSLRLADGRIVRLAAILGPHPPLGRESGRPWPIADEARKALDALIAGKDLGLAFDARRSDRYGRLVAHAVVAGAWVQGEMLTQGFARVETAPDMRAVAREMLAIEATARREPRGLWRLDAYGVLSGARAGRFIDTFQIVEDRARWVRAQGGRNELRLGDGDGVTLLFNAAARRELRAVGLDPRRMVDKPLRVRGWLRSRFGAVLDITHVEQIEGLDR